MASTDMHRKITPISLEVATKFWSFVDICGINECWEWQGGMADKDYGHFHFDGHSWMAHRIAYFLSGKPFDESLFICHHCDNPPCCNSVHLFPGTSRDNILDAKDKGRLNSAYGVDTGHAKLNDETAREALMLYQSGKMNIHMLADKYSLNMVTIWNLIHRRTWKHLNIPGLPVSRTTWRRGERNGRAKLSEDQVRTIRKNFNSGATTQELASVFGVTNCMIRHIVIGIAWKHILK